MQKNIPDGPFYNGLGNDFTDPMALLVMHNAFNEIVDEITDDDDYPDNDREDEERTD